MKAKFDRVTFDVKNLEEAKRFFSQLFDTTFEDQPEGLMERLQITPRPPMMAKFRGALSPLGIELFETDPPVEKEGVRNITWRVDDIEKAKEELIEKGIRHVFDARCGGWKEAVFNANDMHGVRTVLNEYDGNSFFRACMEE